MPQFIHQFDLFPEGQGPEATASTEVQRMGEGDLVIGLQRGDREHGIVTIAVLGDGSFRVVVMDGDTGLLGEVIVPADSDSQKVVPR